ncbi:hypothetical protein COCMIDRAFT_40836 [Bipolaris oryzae ATCC 44560]|uniref:Uncharacterized protein n=1 Tax=Bipolaris oryzae ATCC 44560 TaxID=930090 RepID=W6YTK3_COCMI|nr:uncharacterized protein COCMIDRAFT_40836 [Bipolaris oryzae ATCC 44560]EUC40920.1 hypothetical protein COCMIDRAFT_40836 [Bipolaris oryzae ATCC 44560]
MQTLVRCCGVTATYDGLQTAGHRHPCDLKAVLLWLVSTTFPNDTPSFPRVAYLCAGFKAEETYICQRGIGVGSVHDVPRSCRVSGHDLVHNMAPENTS